MTLKNTPELRATGKSFRTGGIVLILLVLILALAFKAQTGMPFATTTQVQARISDVHSLKVNDDVRENSKRVGRVSDIEYVDGAALVTMTLNGKAQVYRDATAAVWDVSALATKFVELDPGSQSAGALGDRPIQTTHTVDSADLYEVLDVLDAPTRRATVQMLRGLGGGAAGHGTDLQAFLDKAPGLLDHLSTVSAALASDDADLPTLLVATDRLVGRFHGRQQEIAHLVDQTDRTLEAFSTDGGAPLDATLKQLPESLTRAKAALDAVRTPLHDTGVALRGLAPGADALGRSEQDLRGFLVDSVKVAGQVPGVAEQASPVLADLTGTLADARPLAEPVRLAIGDLLAPLRALAPYATDVAQLFVRGASFVSQGPRPGVRYARLGVTPGAATVTSGLLGSINFPQNHYPRPGEAQHDRAQGVSGLPELGGY
jgi:phospholipid/cholesterol/gamma-HCH transport system substrate-binding protein